MKGRPKGEKISLIRRQMCAGKVQIIAVVGDVGAREPPTQAREVKGGDIARAAGRTLNHMQIDEAKLAEVVDDMVELRLGSAAGYAVCRRDGRDADAGACGANLGAHGFGHLVHQAGAVFNRAAIGIRAVVCARLGELVQEVAIARVNLDPVKARRDGIGCRLAGSRR